MSGTSYTNTDMEFILHEVYKERVRQVFDEGYSVYADDCHTHMELARGGAAYAVAKHIDNLGRHPAQLGWPFPEFSFKPTDHRRNLIKAMAMLCAEVERIDRATG